MATFPGRASRRKPLPYARQWIDSADVTAVVNVLRSDWLTDGPKVEEFEDAFADYVGAKSAVAVSNGTAGLHAAVYALGINPGDEVIVSPLTFVATANCVLFQRGTPVFADVDPDTLLLDPEQVEAKLTSRTRAIISVDYAGQPCPYHALSKLASRHGLGLVADSCHALGAELGESRVGTLADLTVFSLHPVKHITGGEGGVVTTNQTELARRVRRFRNHGIDSQGRKRQQQGTWFYQMEDLGHNYRLSDIHCALALSQLGKLEDWLERRRSIAASYDRALASLPGLNPLARQPCSGHAYHLYVVQLDLELLKVDRDRIFHELRSKGIGVNVHYIPVHLHPYYRKEMGTGEGMCPHAERAYQRILSLPIFPRMSEEDVDRVIDTLSGVLREHLA